MSGMLFMDVGGDWKPVGKIDEDSVALTTDGYDDFFPYDLDLLNGAHSFSCELDAERDAIVKLGLSANKARECALKFILDVTRIMDEVEARRRECRRLASTFKRKRRVGGTRNHRAVVYGKYPCDPRTVKVLVPNAHIESSEYGFAVSAKMFERML